MKRRQGHPNPTTPADMLRREGFDPEGLTQRQQLELIKRHWPVPDFTAEDCPNYVCPCRLRGCKCKCHQQPPPAEPPMHHGRPKPAVRREPWTPQRITR